MGKYLGIDAGSVTVSVVLLDEKLEILQTAYEYHEGNFAGKLEEILGSFDLKGPCNVASTSSTPSFVSADAVYDNRVAVIAAVRKFHEKAGSILMVGGEKFGLIRFDENQYYRKFQSNTSCAAGTGSFLDQQCKRLNIPDIGEFSNLAFQNTGDFPKIASRCSVFAKTDLIHAQQEGYSLPEICDGICYGLARNIVDTLFKNSEINRPLIFAGGVSRNRAVARHIAVLTGTQPVSNEFSHLYGALGAAIMLAAENKPARVIRSINEIVTKTEKEKKYFYKPLRLELSDYPDFSSLDSFLFHSEIVANAPAVEVDVYTEIRNPEHNVFLGFDIGSTSTKAVLVDTDKNVLAGFYTRTSGQPVNAMKIILESIHYLSEKYGTGFKVLGAGTTGSGRKFIGKIIGADVMPDEITAHARAATELDPEVDTIIEIGGQDSKFTTLKNGSVTFSVMNNVCAAGTGSFIEEQAAKLGVRLADYQRLAENIEAPMASDRCTVFMERDLNHYINENYTTREILASVLHSVRENYLTKVAVVKNIGNKIFFQGATAKNRALVAAFEQKLKKPIMVSKYCHLTGAYGVALELADMKVAETRFRGIHLYQKEIPVRTEVCELCTNHCKYKIAEIDGAKEVYGFLCGRDYDSGKFVDNNTSGFSLIKEYHRHFSFKPKKKIKDGPVVGIPAGLYLFEDLFLWQRFFELLGIRTITSVRFRDAVKTGKSVSGAEFCAPMSAIQGHALYLLDKADYIFLPTYLEEKQKSKNRRRQYCYYSQYASPVVNSIDLLEKKNNIILPVLFSLQNDLLLMNELYQSLRKAGLNGFNAIDVSRAFLKAQAEKKEKLKDWQSRYRLLSADDNQLKVVLLGRPYTVLSEGMNNHIPDIFARHGVKTFYQNMMEIKEEELDGIQEILGATKWKFAAAILAAADKTARTEGTYPVLITSFKCTPDSFVIEYFKQIMDFYDKPYLILQLDEHDSSVGYETRIEAALRSFQNHFGKNHGKEKILKNEPDPYVITHHSQLKGKLVLLPDLGKYVSQLIEANLRRIGIEARILEDTEESIKLSQLSNSGQCLPLNIILQNTFDFMEKNHPDPENTVLWMIESSLSCNLGMFVNYMRKVFAAQKNDYSKISIYKGDITFSEISINTTVNMYLAFLIGGFLRKVECKIRPYETVKGQTDEVIAKSMELLYNTFLEGTSKEKAVKTVTSWLKEIPVKMEKRPRVAIFGDFYVRDNDVFNQNLIRFIEENGGEVITTPYSEYVKIMVHASNARLIREGFYFRASLQKLLINLVTALDEKYLKYFNEILHEPVFKPLKNYREKLDVFHLRAVFNGESLENALKIMHLKEHYPDIAFFVQTNPSYCCPSLVTQAMTPKIEKVTGIPVVTIEYDGTSSNKNESIIPFLKFARVEAADKS